jgi:transposase-like protein
MKEEERITSETLAMRTYDKDFKINAVNLYKSSGKSLKTIAQEFGLATSTLSKWVDQHSQIGDESFPGKGHAKASEEEVRTLRKELMHVRQERDILKKAVAIFSGPQGRGTSL